MPVGFVQGVYNMLVWVVDSNGYPMGDSNDPDNEIGPQVLSAYRINHPTTLTPAIPTRGQATDRGGSTVLGTKDTGMEELPSASIELSDFDLLFDALVTLGGVDTSYSNGWVQGGANHGNPAPPRVGMALLGGWNSRDAADYDDPEILGTTYPSCQITPGYPAQNQNSGVNPSAVTYTIKVANSKYRIDGVPYSLISGLNYHNDETFVHPMKREEQWHMVTWVADGSASSFTLPYLPLYSDATVNGRNIISRNRQQINVTSVNTTTGLVTLTGTYTALDRIKVIYPTAWQTV